MIASLPMYDLPPLHAVNDRYWHSIRSTLGYGPSVLTRSDDLWAQWSSPDLLLSQTCGYPYRARLHGKVQLVATPDFGLPDCPPGYYNSVFLVRKNDASRTLKDISKGRFAYNEPLSQSGWAAPKLHFDALSLTFGKLLQTGSHRQSADAVASGRADFAALDAQTWRLLSKHTDLAGKLDVVGRTSPTPALPYITALGQDTAAIAAAMIEALGALPREAKDTLGITKIVRIPAKDYLAVPTPEPPAT